MADGPSRTSFSSDARDGRRWPSAALISAIRRSARRFVKKLMGDVGGSCVLVTGGDGSSSGEFGSTSRRRHRWRRQAAALCHAAAAPRGPPPGAAPTCFRYNPRSPAHAAPTVSTDPRMHGRSTRPGPPLGRELCRTLPGDASGGRQSCEVRPIGGRRGRSWRSNWASRSGGYAQALAADLQACLRAAPGLEDAVVDGRLAGRRPTPVQGQLQPLPGHPQRHRRRLGQGRRRQVHHGRQPGAGPGARRRPGRPARRRHLRAEPAPHDGAAGRTADRAATASASSRSRRTASRSCRSAS